MNLHDNSLSAYPNEKEVLTDSLTWMLNGHNDKHLGATPLKDYKEKQLKKDKDGLFHIYLFNCWLYIQ